MNLKEHTFVCVLVCVLFLKVCSFARLTFGLVEVADRTNRQEGMEGGRKDNIHGITL